jgi:hydroxymethylpyrimidine/phosphomethylpyrimidine kinase
MTPPSDLISPTDTADDSEEDEGSLPLVACFNSVDPTGAAGLAADVLSAASVGAHALPLCAGAWVRDTREIYDHTAMDADALADQVKAISQDMVLGAIKLGFVGTPDNLSVAAALASDFDDIPLVAYMPDLSWWDETSIEIYLSAFEDLVMSETAVLVGNYNTLWRWLLPDWTHDRRPSAREVAKAANERGAAYVLCTGMVGADGQMEVILANAEAVVLSIKHDKLDIQFHGAGETLSAALAAGLATGLDLVAAAGEAVTYTEQCLEQGVQLGMGRAQPERLYWAGTEDHEEPEIPLH